MERIINNELINYLLPSKLITKEQHGFIRKRCIHTCTKILESLHDWCFNFQCHVPTVVYFDFKEAFDSVSHPKLLTKLYCLWHKRITSFLYMRLQVVKLNNILFSRCICNK